MANYYANSRGNKRLKDFKELAELSEKCSCKSFFDIISSTRNKGSVLSRESKSSYDKSLRDFIK